MRHVCMCGRCGGCEGECVRCVRVCVCVLCVFLGGGGGVRYTCDFFRKKVSMRVYLGARITLRVRTLRHTCPYDEYATPFHKGEWLNRERSIYVSIYERTE